MNKALFFVLLALCASAVVVSADEDFAPEADLDMMEETADYQDEAPETEEDEDVDEDESEGEDEDEDEDEEDEDAPIVTASAGTNAALTSIADSFAAPGSVPRDTLNAFATELKHIAKVLADKKVKIETRIATLKKTVEDLKTKIQGEKDKIARIISKGKSLKHELLKEDKSEYAQAVRAQEAKIKDLKASLAWTKTLHEKVNVLKDGADTVAAAAASPSTVAAPTAASIKEYEETLADVKQDLADNVDEAEAITGLDITSELEDLDSAEELEEVEKKLYESSKLKGLVTNMEDKLQKQINEAIEALRKIHEAHLPAHLTKGLAAARAALAQYTKDLAVAQAALDKAQKNSAAKLSAIAAELAKLDAIKAHIYGGSNTAAPVTEDDEESEDDESEETEEPEEEDAEESEDSEEEPEEEDVEEEETNEDEPEEEDESEDDESEEEPEEDAEESEDDEDEDEDETEEPEEETESDDEDETEEPEEDVEESEDDESEDEDEDESEPEEEDEDEDEEESEEDDE